jgi:major type 1 subunit fimbrin (pilin)
MVFKMKKIALALSFILAGVSHFATAADGQIKFTGNITANTCSINGGTPGQQQVPLGDVPASSLAASGQTAGAKNFSLVLTECTGGTTAVAARFESIALGTLAGRLLLDSSSVAENVEIALYDSMGVPQPVNGAIPASSYVTLTGGNATLEYVASFYATGEATTGAANSEVSYTLSYQ